MEVAPAPLDAASAPAEDFEELLTVVTSDEQGSSVQPLRPDRPLDEWVLDYLIQSAQRRKASS